MQRALRYTQDKPFGILRTTDLRRSAHKDMVAILHERPEDGRAIRFVLEEAFGQSNEANLVDALRRRGALTLSLVALREDEVVGHIAFCPVTIESAESSFNAIALGPMAVLPPYQGKGIGSQLVRIGLAKCRQAGHEIVFVLGHLPAVEKIVISLSSWQG